MAHRGVQTYILAEGLLLMEDQQADLGLAQRSGEHGLQPPQEGATFLLQYAPTGAPQLD